MQMNGQTETLSFNLSAFKLIRFDVTDLRLRRQSIRKIARSLALHQLQECEHIDPSVDVFSDSPDLGMKDLNEICEHLSQSNLKSPGDLIRKACASTASLQLLCCQMAFATKKTFQDLLLDPLHAIEPDVNAVARKYAHALKAYSTFRIDALRQDRPGHFLAIDYAQHAKGDMNAVANPLTMMTTIKNNAAPVKLQIAKTSLRSQPNSFEVFQQMADDIQALNLTNENIWICTRDEAVAGKILKEILASTPKLNTKFVKSFDRMTPLVLLSEIATSEQNTGHLIFSWDYLDYYETVRL